MGSPVSHIMVNLFMENLGKEMLRTSGEHNLPKNLEEVHGLYV